MRITKSVLACCALVAVGNFLMLWFDEGWLELLGDLLMMSAVVLAGYSPSWRKIHTDVVIEDKKRVDPRRARE